MALFDILDATDALIAHDFLYNMLKTYTFSSEDINKIKKNYKQGKLNYILAYGLMAENGYGIKQNYEKSFKAISRLPRNSEVSCLLGYYYLHGYGCTKNYRKAMKYLKLSQLVLTKNLLILLKNVVVFLFGMQIKKL